MDFEFISHKDEIIAEAKAARRRALEAVGLQAEGYAKMNLTVPIEHGYDRGNGYTFPITDTGRLMNSISHTTDEEYAYIGTNVEYAPYVEYGTSKSKPYPFLKPAAADHADEYKEIFEEYLKG